MDKNVYGLSSVLIGDIANDGGMGTVLAELLGATKKDSASLIETEATYEDVPIEETPGTYRKIETAPAKWELKLSSYAVSAQKLAELKGGTYTPAVAANGGTAAVPASWEAPLKSFQLNKSVKAVSQSGFVFEIPKMFISVKATFNLAVSQMGTLDVTGTVMIPDKAGVGPIKISEPA